MEEPDDLQPIDEGEEETEFATIAGGATIEEAKSTALDQLRKIVPYVNPADVEYVIVDEGNTIIDDRTATVCRAVPSVRIFISHGQIHR